MTSQCSQNKFGINFCHDWCNTNGFWGCGVATLGGDDGRNTDNVDYTCDCNGCNGCGLASSNEPSVQPSNAPTYCVQMNAEYDIIVDATKEVVGWQKLTTNGCTANIESEFYGTRHDYSMPISGNRLGPATFGFDVYYATVVEDELHWTLNGDAFFAFSRKKQAKPALEFELQGRKGVEQVKIVVGSTEQELTLSKSWQKFSFVMPSSGVYSIQFKNDASGRDVYYRSSLITSVTMGKFGGWKCGEENENSRCRSVRDGKMNWNGVYTHTWINGCAAQTVPVGCYKAITAPFVLEDDYAWVPDTKKDNNNNGPGKVAFTFTCTAATKVSFSLEVIAPNGKDDSFFMGVDEDNKRKWHVRRGSDWHWAYHNSKHSVTAGTHTLYVYQREDGTKFRTLRIDSGSDSCSFSDSELRRLLRAMH